MALNRRNGQRFEANIWPGFVDAMTALLLVLVFVLSIFMIVQFMLSETITAQDGELDSLNLELSELFEELGLEQTRSQELTAQAENLNAELDEQSLAASRQATLIASLQQQTLEQSGRIGNFEEQVAALLSQQGRLENQVATFGQQRDALQATVETLSEENRTADETVNTLTARLSDIEAGLAREITEKEAAQLALAQARSEIDVSSEEARLAAARREALEALVADLRSDVDQKNQTLAEANAALSEVEAARLVDAAAADALRERIEGGSAELTAMSLALEEKRREAEQTLTLLAAAKSAENSLNSQLIAALSAAKAAQDANTSVAALEAQLDAANVERDTAKTELDQTRSDADAIALDLLTKLKATQEDAERSGLSLREELAVALAAQNAARLEAEGAITSSEQRQALLAAAQTELLQERELSSQNVRQIEALNQQVAQLRSQLGGLQDLLDASSSRDSDANIEIQSLGNQLNRALAQVASEQKNLAVEQARVAEEQRLRAELEEAARLRLEDEAKELKNYRSEFFGQLRDLLGDQDGIRIEGDRFVFSSEVLFRTGQATLSVAGQAEIAKVAGILTQISGDIPDTLDWVIRVDGHTDNVPNNGNGKYADNWELSQGRALSVVRYMSEALGIPPERLAANGFGEFQPIAEGNTTEARALNRRIELKLTER